MPRTIKKKDEDKRSLDGRRIVLTRNKEQSIELRSKLEALGAEVLDLPLIKIFPYCEPQELDDVFGEIGGYEWIIFTSRNGVHHFFNFFFKRFKDIRCIGGLRIACVGGGTAAELRKYYLEVDFIPEEALAENLANGLIEYQDLDNTKILVITGNLNSDTLIETLEKKGRAIVDTLKVYETELEDLSNSKEAENFRKKGADAVIFASSSAVDSFVRQVKVLQLAPEARKPKTCSIGPITTKTMKELGIPVDIEAQDHTIDGIVNALLDHFSDKVLY